MLKDVVCMHMCVRMYHMAIHTAKGVREAADWETDTIYYKNIRRKSDGDVIMLH